MSPTCSPDTPTAREDRDRRNTWKLTGQLGWIWINCYCPSYLQLLSLGTGERNRFSKTGQMLAPKEFLVQWDGFKKIKNKIKGRGIKRTHMAWTLDLHIHNPVYMYPNAYIHTLTPHMYTHTHTISTHQCLEMKAKEQYAQRQRTRERRDWGK